MKGLVIGFLAGLGILAVSGLLVATSLIHPILPLVIPSVMVLGLFSYIGYRSQQ